jgi:hypothetical protein
MLGVEGGPMGAVDESGNGVHTNGTTFEPLPSGSLAPPSPEEVAQLPPARLDAGFAEKLLGPAPGSPAREMHTNIGDDEPKKPAKATDKVGRNELCPCGSGKKFKRCHGVAV